jgi:hypothetical protein
MGRVASQKFFALFPKKNPAGFKTEEANIHFGRGAAGKADVTR